MRINHLYFPVFLLSLLLVSCTEQNEKAPLEDFYFAIDNGSELIYKTHSVFFHEKTDSVRFKQSAEIKNRLLSQSEKKGVHYYQWELLPGWSVKELPDTLYYEINERGVFCHYNQRLFEGSEQPFLLFPLPLKAGKTWKTKFFNYPADASCNLTDTLIETKTGNFRCFKIDYRFTPDYMNSFIKDSIHYEVKAHMSDFFSREGKILSRITYYMTERSNPGKTWPLLKSETILINRKIKD